MGCCGMMHVVLGSRRKQRSESNAFFNQFELVAAIAEEAGPKEGYGALARIRDSASYNDLEPSTRDRLERAHMAYAQSADDDEWVNG